MTFTFRSASCGPNNHPALPAWRTTLRQALIALAALMASGLMQPAMAQLVGQLKLNALAGTPIADGVGGSSRLSIEPTLTLPGPERTVRAQARLRHWRGEHVQRTDLDLRELTVQWRRPDLAASLGAQQIQWGRMDLIPITDTLNPLDHHELFVQDLPDAKLALWMLNLEWQRGDHTLQGIVSPQVPMDRLRATPATLALAPQKPGSSWDHTTWGLRYGVAALGWNADLIALRGWRSTPELKWATDPWGAPRLEASPTPLYSLGFSADRPIGPTVLRLEGQTGRRDTPILTASARPELQTLRAWGIGLDLPWGEWFMATQALYQEGWSATNPNALWLSLIVQRKFDQDRLALRAITLHEQDPHAVWTSLQARYELNAYTVLQLQADRFSGPPQTLLGMLQGQSRVALAVQMLF